jgi:elongator complex protein 1
MTRFQDPREYLPFLRELRALDKHYQRFRIDDHLRRYEKALLNLSHAGDYAARVIFNDGFLTKRSGPDHFWEAMEYVERHQLYESALPIWSGTDKYKVCIFAASVFDGRDFSWYTQSVLDIYGDWLFERREFTQAALGWCSP